MNWYKMKKIASDEDTLRYFYKYLTEVYRDIETVYMEVMLWPHITPGSPRDIHIAELASAFFGKFKAVFNTLEDVRGEALEWFFKDSSYGSKERTIEIFLYNINRIREDLSEAEINIDKFKNKTDKFGENPISISELLLRETKQRMFLLRKALYNAFIVPNNLEDITIVQEFQQFNLEGEPTYREVSDIDRPSFGYGWKKKNEGTGEWEWWKENWDTSD